MTHVLVLKIYEPNTVPVMEMIGGQTPVSMRNTKKRKSHNLKKHRGLSQIHVEEKNSNEVKAAIQRSLDMPHFKNTFITRNPGPESEGSTFKRRQTPQSLMKANWKPFSHPSIQAPAIGYSAPIPGTMNIVKLTELDPDTPVRMVLGHKGETPFVTALLSPRDIGMTGIPVDHTVILLGPGEDGLIVWTFFPGDPIMPSSTEPSAETDAVETVEDAINLGFMYGKIAGR